MTEIHFPETFVNRSPTKQEALLVFSACIFPIHIWITIVFLYNFPSLILKASLWQILGVLAYSLVFALIESLLLFGFLVLLVVILPRKVLRERFVHLGTLLALVIAGLALLVNTQFMQAASWAWVLVLGATGVGWFASLRRPVDESLQTTLAERLTLIATRHQIQDIMALLFLAASSILL